jgi:hypothetical protein
VISPIICKVYVNANLPDKTSGTRTAYFRERAEKNMYIAMVILGIPLKVEETTF